MKTMLHPRNPHRERYDFPKLILAHPELGQFVAKNKYGDDSIDFANPEAVKALNRALLHDFYGITNWDIPKNYLCPPIPGRADYIHYAADLLASSNLGKIPRGAEVRVLDIGVGANCIYPIIGTIEYGWSFVGADINPVSLKSAKAIVELNSVLQGRVELRLQSNEKSIFKGLIKKEEYFDLTTCNPPFHASLEEAQSGTKRKWKNLGKSIKHEKQTVNFGGQGAELWCEGGELAFIQRMVRESVEFKNQVKWFSTLVSKEQTLPALEKTLKEVQARRWETIDMAQGQKKSRVVAWSFTEARTMSENS